MTTIEPDINLIKLAQPLDLGRDSKFKPICVAKLAPALVKQNFTASNNNNNNNNGNNSSISCFSSGWGKLTFRMIQEF